MENSLSLEKGHPNVSGREEVREREGHRLG